MKGELMKTYIAYFDETGDDGVTTNSSDHFILTSLYMPAESWQQIPILQKPLSRWEWTVFPLFLPVYFL